MPKPTPFPRPTQKTTKRFNKKRIALLGILLILLLSASVLVYYKISHARAITQEKADFARAEKDINAVTKDIIAELGEPLRKDDLKGCSKPNQKLDTGKMSCQVGVTLFYQAKDPDFANEKINKIESIILENGSIKSTENQSAYFIANTTNDPFYNTKVASFDLYNVGLTCMKAYSYYSGSTPPLKAFPRVDDSNILELSYSCK